MPRPSTRIRPRGVVRTAIVATPEAACVDVDGVDELDPYLPELLALEPLEVPADVLPDAFAEPPQPAARRAAARTARAEAGAMRGLFMGLPPGLCFPRKYGRAGRCGCRSGAA
jgi:hypothetical protein